MLSPYHQFANCPALRAEIARLRRTNAVPQNLLEQHQVYHYALFHKLRSARYHVGRLRAILTDEFPGQGAVDHAALLSQANMHIDGFFYFGGSALDILAREVLAYFAIPLPSSVYFQTARQQLSQARANDPLLGRLADPAWKREFSNYRNSATHELLLADSVTYNVKVVGGAEQETEVVLSLPDDPRAAPSQRTYNRNQDALLYCEQHLRRIISLGNQIYGDIAARIRTTNQLPL